MAIFLLSRTFRPNPGERCQDWLAMIFTPVLEERNKGRYKSTSNNYYVNILEINCTFTTMQIDVIVQKT